MSKAIYEWSELWVGKQSEPLRVLAVVRERKRAGENESSHFSCLSPYHWHKSSDLRPDLNWHESPDSCQAAHQLTSLANNFACAAGKLSRIMCTKGIHGELLIFTLDIYAWLIDTWTTTYADSWSASQSTVDRELTNFRRHSIECRSIHMSWSTLGQLLTDCQSSDLCWWRCRPCIDDHAIRGTAEYWLRCRSSDDHGWTKGIDRHSTVDAFSTPFVSMLTLPDYPGVSCI